MDEIFKVDEYIEMVLIVVKVVGFFIFFLLNDMLKIFVILGSKCVVCGYNDSMWVDE